VELRPRDQARAVILAHRQDARILARLLDGGSAIRTLTSSWWVQASPGCTCSSACVDEAQRQGVVVLRNRKPVSLIVGMEGLDREQLDLGSNDGFWRLIAS